MPTNEMAARLEGENNAKAAVFIKQRAVELDQQKALERIYTLDIAKQKHIFETYYGGKLEVIADES